MQAQHTPRTFASPMNKSALSSEMFDFVTCHRGRGYTCAWCTPGPTGSNCANKQSRRPTLSVGGPDSVCWGTSTGTCALTFLITCNAPSVSLWASVKRARGELPSKTDRAAVHTLTFCTGPTEAGPGAGPESTAAGLEEPQPIVRCYRPVLPNPVHPAGFGFKHLRKKQVHPQQGPWRSHSKLLGASLPWVGSPRGRTVLTTD